MEERSPFEGIDDPILRVQMEHEMRAIEELVFVTKLSFVPAHTQGQGGRVPGCPFVRSLQVV